MVLFTLMGSLAGVASVLDLTRFATTNIGGHQTTALAAIAAVVIGGTSLAGGRCTMIGTFFGVITFALVFNLLTLENVESQIQQILRGVIILGAVVVQRRGH